jgi:hypothetical protein
MAMKSPFSFASKVYPGGKRRRAGKEGASAEGRDKDFTFEKKIVIKFY